MLVPLRNEFSRKTPTVSLYSSTFFVIRILFLIIHGKEERRILFTHIFFSSPGYDEIVYVQSHVDKWFFFCQRLTLKMDFYYTIKKDQGLKDMVF